MERIFNLRSGLASTDDWLPKRFYEEPSPAGPIKGHKIDVQAYQKMLEEYYAMRGWDSAGVPGVDRIEALNLEFTISD